MSKYRVEIELDERWFNLLGELSRNTDGFIWVSVKEEGE